MPREKRSRRGSTIVMVALMLVAFAAVGAIAADIGRFYVVAGELQTAADAAALRGAAVLQVTTGNSPKSTIDPVVLAWVGATNLSDGTTPNVVADSIHMALYTPASTNGNTVTPASLVLDPAGRPNAVYVAVYNQPKGIFAQVMGRATGPQIARRGVAWVANVSLNCIRPWAFPYTPFYKRVAGLLPNANVAFPAPDVTAAQMVNYQQNATLADRTFIVLPPGATYPYMYPSDSSWRGYNPPSSNSGNANSGKTTFQDFLTDCSNVSVNSDAGNGNTVPNQGSGGSCGAPEKTACWTQDVIDTPQSGGNSNNNDPICATMRPGDAGCYQTTSDTMPGVTVDIAWSDIVGNGQSVDFRYVGEFEFKCFFMNTTDTCSAITGAQKTGYPVGTIVGVAAGLKSRKLNPTDILSNAPSNVQRLILVK
jgi:Flp pilus assembly protein TadG